VIDGTKIFLPPRKKIYQKKKHSIPLDPGHRQWREEGQGVWRRRRRFAFCAERMPDMLGEMKVMGYNPPISERPDPWIHKKLVPRGSTQIFKSVPW
jgi:hypothetical protein